ncbi:GNAT family N-acetyltransferase [Streptomyces sp. NBC_01462]|uniref:GNAT family N-acetyltransferase n=1 Tax=Streptomyces sp. NBC_01462 TaxID=2903876 RepID=UPI002E2FE576|nr:GNAT family N-acetyltransferase [Streptomyces sp. NBC_01462]
MSDYRITRYTPHDRQAVVQFQEMLWQGGPQGNSSYLDWKFADNPYLDDRYVTLAWEENELVGMLGVFGSSWEVDGHGKVMLPCLADTVVAPAHRGGPLFGLMLEWLIDRLHADGVPWLLDFGDQPAGPAMLMNGWTAVGPWPVAGAERGAPVKPQVAWEDLEAVRGSRSGVVIRPLATSSPELPKLASRLATRGSVRVVRDEEYFGWRAANPLARYFHLVADSNGTVGYLIAHRTSVDTDDGPTPTTIVECEAVDDDIWCDLIEAALATVPGKVVTMWVRDLPPSRIHGIESLGLSLTEPTGRLSQDIHLPKLVMRSTGVLDGHASPLTTLSSPSVWDMRGVSGRGWR